jgi:hypothetical protein
MQGKFSHASHLSPVINPPRILSPCAFLSETQQISGDPAEFLACIDPNRILRRGEITRLCMDALKVEGAVGYSGID